MNANIVMPLPKIDTFFSIPLDNVATLPARNYDKNKADLLVNEFRPNKYLANHLEMDDSKSILDDLQSEQQKKDKLLGKRLFHTFRINNSFYTKTQKWIGHVTEINEDGFIAVLNDLSNGGTDEIGEFYFDEITDEDRSLITLGAAFYFSLGLASNNGSIRRESEIRFQRLIALEEDEMINKGLDLSSEFINYFK